VTAVALVGLGGISFEHLTKLRDVPDAHVVGVCDLSATLGLAVAERFRVGPAFTSYERMLEESAPDVVHVLTPPSSHPELVRGALEAGAHVFVEKPIAPTLAQFRELRDLARSRERMLCENYTYRFAPVVLRALDAARQGDLGEVISVDVSYHGVMGSEGPYGDPEIVHFAHSLPGGALQNFVSHPVAVALAFMDGIVGVSSWRRRLDPGFASDDELVALLSGERTCASVAVSGRAHPPGFVVRVFGTEASIEVDVLAETMHRRADSSALKGPARRGLGELAGVARRSALKLAGRGDPYFAGLRVLLRRFYAAVQTGGPQPLSLEEMDAVNAAVCEIFSDGSLR
jgi:predicted dehydrogenase